LKVDIDLWKHLKTCWKLVFHPAGQTS